MIILNLTQHPATPEQIAEGVVDLEGENLILLKKLLTFEEKPTIDIVEDRAKALAKLVSSVVVATDVEEEDDRRVHDDGTAIFVMIGGAPYLMGPLERELEEEDRVFMHSFSKRVSVEEIQEDGSVNKTNVFKHLGFIS